ncbi:MAG: UDP-N-acetylglucosamine 1-carboxyvinyltransferase [Firmicutes bacterium]|nr:UDP-N-acetylglucosamine 1-carboxyvinyltransferase [Bacillota bacterium]
MEKYVISGGVPLRGSVNVGGMKNAALPIIFATVLVNGKCRLENIPNISDVATSLKILRGMGADIRMLDKTTVEIDTSHIVGSTSEYDLVRTIRGSYYLLGAELGRFGESHTAYPGGCDFGTRPIDYHIKGFEALGAEYSVKNGYISLRAPLGVRGSAIYVDGVSVGATINIMLAAVLAKGITTIDNAAKEPHVVDVANFLNTCGARISGAGTDMIKIRGVESLHGCNYAIIPDMIEAGTFMIAAAATGGHVRINNVIPKHLESITAKLIEIGAKVDTMDDYVMVSGNGKYKKTSIKTLPYPGFPTDLHPQMAPLLAVANGVSYIKETIWPKRFRYVDELKCMGANIKVEDNMAIIEGIDSLSPAVVKAVDLRAGFAVLIAGLMTNGITEIYNIQYIERGYEDLIPKLTGLGARIKKINAPDDIATEKKSKLNDCLMWRI